MIAAPFWTDTASFMRQNGLRITLATAALGLATSMCALADKAVKTNVAAMLEVQQLESKRFAAQIGADIKTLDSLLAENLTYCHSTGACDSKRQFIDSIGSGALRYLAIEPSNVNARNFGDTVIVTGVAAFKVAAGGKEQDLRVSYTDVYVKLGGRWRMAAWHSARIPDSPAP